MIDITELDQLNSLLQKNTYVLVDFYTPSCPPCQSIAPYLEELADQYPLVSFVKVNCNTSVDIPQAYDIGAVPTFLLFTNGKKAAVKYGSNKEELLAAIKENFSQ
jgi:thioredoxin 1